MEKLRIIGVIVEDSSKTHVALAINETMYTLSEQTRKEILAGEIDCKEDNTRSYQEQTTFTAFIKNVLKPNFDGKYYNLSREETNEYYNWLTPEVRKTDNPPTFQGYVILPRDNIK